LRESEKSTRNT